MDFKLEQSGAVGVLTLNGALTIGCAEELKATLMKSLERVEHLVLNLGTVEEVDLSCLQLLCSAHRTSTRLNKQMTIAGGRPEAFRRAVCAGGYGRHVGCSFDIHKTCLWLGGNDTWEKV